jgi:hypothetical protein
VVLDRIVSVSDIKTIAQGDQVTTFSSRMLDCDGTIMVSICWTETVQHFVRCCEALARQRYIYGTVRRTKRYKHSLSKGPLLLYKRHRAIESVLKGIFKGKGHLITGYQEPRGGVAV